MRRQPEQIRKGKVESIKRKGRMIPIPQIISSRAIDRTILGLKYLTQSMRLARTSMGWKNRKVPPIVKIKKSKNVSDTCRIFMLECLGGG
tara:strand:- start:19 stop:288 length:270 start_codon:yes stop_codon:yes gene_type:complete